MNRVLIVGGSDLARKAAISLALLQLQIHTAEATEDVEYPIHAPTRCDEVTVKPHKTYLNLAKKDRWQR